MGFDWDAIRAQDNADLAFYRLLGEMLQRRATPRDMQQIRGFLGSVRPGPDAWHSLGEALFHTTGGSQGGYDLWCEWARALGGVPFAEDEHRAAWERFRADLSDGLEEHSEPPTVQFETLDETFESDAEVDHGEDADTGNLTRTQVVPKNAHTRLADRSDAELLPMLPAGPYTIRLLGQVWEGVDEFALLRLLRRGVFLGVDVLFGARWVNVAEHPGFQLIVDRLRAESRSVLGEVALLEAEVTRPGN